MPGAVYRLLVLLTTLVEPLPVGTNPGLLHRLWMLASGRLLESRGELVAGEGQTPARGIRAHMHGGYRPVAVDVTALRVWVERRNGCDRPGHLGHGADQPGGAVDGQVAEQPAGLVPDARLELCRGETGVTRRGIVSVGSGRREGSARLPS